MITTRTIKPEQLTHSEICEWEWMVRANPALCSPFFRPEFTLAVGRVRADAHVVVVEKQGLPVAFLPFQGAKRGEQVAIGASLNDFQGVISATDANYSVSEIMKLAGIKQMFCAKLLDWQHSFKSFAIAENPSPFVDLTNGYGAWESHLKKSGRSHLKQLARKERKLIRERGPIHFDYHTTSTDVLRQLIDWKRIQYHRTNEIDTLAARWTNDLLHSLLDLPQNSELQPILSALYAGGSLVAAHYSLSAPGVCHSWFPSYNPEFAVYSPGKLMLRRLLFEAPEQGIQRFDFGTGDEPYKYTFANDSVRVCRTIIDRNPVRRWLRSNLYRVRMAVKASPFGPGIRETRGRLRRLAGELQTTRIFTSATGSHVGATTDVPSTTSRTEPVPPQQDNTDQNTFVEVHKS